MTTAERIKDYIIENNETFERVAKESDIPIISFMAIMNGEREITAEEYFYICESLHVPPYYFANR